MNAKAIRGKEFPIAYPALQLSRVERAMSLNGSQFGDRGDVAFR